jgi:glutamate carboxypeptidase
MTIELERMIAGMAAWVAIESPTHHVKGVNAMIDAAARMAAIDGVAQERIPGRDGLGDVLVLRAGPQTDKAGVLVMSHVDTVHPVGTLARDLPWRREGDRLYGPGIYDMKGGVYLALHAFLAVAASHKAQLPLTYLITPDEEIGSPTTRGLIEDHARHSAYALVTEPGRDGGKVVTGRKGVGRFEVVLEGRPSHSGSRHQDGRSAIREAARQILAIEGMTDYAKGVTTTVGTMSGGTAANVVPQFARFSVDLRVVDAQEGEACVAGIMGLRPHDPDVAITVTGGMNRPPFPRTPEGVALFEHARTLAGGMGVTLGDVPLSGGGSDGNFTAALGVPTLDGLGIDGDGAHTLHEYGLISSIAPRTLLMQRLLETLG